MQGEGSRTELLERFRELGNAVLVGSQSFWEGVDVRGEALSLVVIDKLPFAPPDDPVLAARIDKINREGRNAFMEYQLPQAVITLKQGAGRLIRDETDRGVLMICDPRLVSAKRYGKRIWRSLPPMKRTREVDGRDGVFRAVRAATAPALGGPDSAYALSASGRAEAASSRGAEVFPQRREEQHPQDHDDHRGGDALRRRVVRWRSRPRPSARHSASTGTGHQLEDEIDTDRQQDRVRRDSPAPG